MAPPYSDPADHSPILHAWTCECAACNPISAQRESPPDPAPDCLDLALTREDLEVLSHWGAYFGEPMAAPAKRLLDRIEGLLRPETFTKTIEEYGHEFAELKRLEKEAEDRHEVAPEGMIRLRPGEWMRCVECRVHVIRPTETRIYHTRCWYCRQKETA